MNFSTLRQYAKYHGVQLGERVGTHAVGYLGAMLRHEGEPLDEARDRVVRELTHTEDAERLKRRHVTSISHGPSFIVVRGALEAAANDLLKSVKIDPIMWDEAAPTKG